MFFVYVLRCSDGSLYVGHTDDMDERMRQHETGACGSYAGRRQPLQLLHVEEFETRYEALQMERKLKGWSRAKKLAYIDQNWTRVSALSKGKHQWERPQ